MPRGLGRSDRAGRVWAASMAASASAAVGCSAGPGPWVLVLMATPRSRRKRVCNAKSLASRSGARLPSRRLAWGAVAGEGRRAGSAAGGLAEGSAGDDHLLDLAGALVDAEEAHVAVDAL